MITALLEGGMKQVLSRIVRSSYPVTSPAERGCSRSLQGQYGTFAGLTALCWQPDALCNLLAFKSHLKVIQNTFCWQFSGGESPILSTSNVP